MYIYHLQCNFSEHLILAVKIAPVEVTTLTIAGPLSRYICLHLRHAEPGLLRGWPFGMDGLPALPLAFRSLPIVFSLKFLQKLKTTLFGRAGVWSASE